MTSSTPRSIQIASVRHRKNNYFEIYWRAFQYIWVLRYTNTINHHIILFSNLKLSRLNYLFSCAMSWDSSASSLSIFLLELFPPPGGQAGTRQPQQRAQLQFQWAGSAHTARSHRAQHRGFVRKNNPKAKPATTKNPTQNKTKQPHHFSYS